MNHLMKRLMFAVFLAGAVTAAGAQSKTTQALQDRFDESLTLYFYKNTLRMLNQQEDKDFDALINNIEKMKFLMVDKAKGHFGAGEYKELVADYQKEKYEMIVNSRIEGKNFDVYLRDSKGDKPGTVVLVNDSTSLYVLDIVGTFDISKAGSLFSTLDGSTDIGKRIRNFATDAKDDTVRRKRRGRIH